MYRNKICIIGPFPPIKGGISQYNELLANELKKTSDVYCLSYKRQYPKFLIKNREQMDINCKTSSEIDFSIDSVNPFSWILSAIRVYKFKPNLVVLPWWVIYWVPMYIFLLSFFRFMNIRTLLICHNIYEHEDNVLKKFFSKSVLKMSNTFLVHTESEKIKLNKIVGNQKIIKHLLPIFLNRDDCCENITSIERDPNKLKLLFFGFVRPYKGLDLLLEALTYINNPNIYLTIAGEFWSNKKEYLDYISKNKLINIEIIDKYIPTNIMNKLFNECDVVVLPYKDATGSAIIASTYSYLKPVLITNVGGLPDAVVHKKTGYIVDKTPQDFAKGIEWFAKNMGMNFKVEIADFVEKKMSWASLVKKILEIERLDKC